MTDPYLIGVIALVVLAWAAAAILLQRWGAGYPNRAVHCPHKDARAVISTFARTRDGWGRGVERDILSCSLLGDGPVTCDKGCLVQLH